ncbi:hypothetical protein T01_11073 [Trichinella spiralis]|uniref:Uncharacterized protein n=1 Tax=Trichinella spiralis TaxID=6334 RepID=A0A0V1BCW4_TRISP|nr:hypothetical protein T01_11073 [Trichinella spiralis]
MIWASKECKHFQRLHECFMVAVLSKRYDYAKETEEEAVQIAQYGWKWIDWKNDSNIKSASISSDSATAHDRKKLPKLRSRFFEKLYKGLRCGSKLIEWKNDSNFKSASILIKTKCKEDSSLAQSLRCIVGEFGGITLSDERSDQKRTDLSEEAMFYGENSNYRMILKPITDKNTHVSLIPM